MSKTMTPIELAVCDNHLTEYPDDWSFDRVCAVLLAQGEGDPKLELSDLEKVQVWEMFEDWDRAFLVQHMEDIVGSFNNYNK